MTVHSLGYLRFTTSQPLEQWEEFATGVLGAACVKHDSTLWLRVDERNFRVEISQASVSGLAGVGLDVGYESSLRAIEKNLAQAGMEIRQGTEAECEARGVLELCFCQDPSGTPLELFYGQMTVQEPFVSPQGVRFITGELGLGHIVVRVARYEETLRFYCDLLGFHITDVWSGKNATAAFMHCNSRHHSIALRKVDVEEDCSVGHFMLEVSSLGAVGMAQDRGAHVLTRTIGQHFNDEMVSCYFRTPSGFDVEYGTGGRVIDKETWMVGQIDAPSGWGHKTIAAK